MNQVVIEAERSILCAILMRNDAYDKVAHVLKWEHFVTPIGQRMYQAMSKQLEAGGSCDVMTVFADLSRKDPDIAIEDVHAFTLAGGLSSMVKRYAKILMDHYIRKQLMDAGQAIIEFGRDQESSVDDLRARAVALLEKLDEASSRGKEPVIIGDLMTDYLDKLQRHADGEIPSLFIPTGFTQLDSLLNGGLRGGKVYVLAARPSVGKSSIAQAICQNAAFAGFPSALFSQEMPNEEMVDRFISSTGRVEMGFHGRGGESESSPYGRALDAVERTRDLPFWLFDGAGLRLQEISAHARSLKRKRGLRVLAIDYLQLCQSVNPKLSRHHQIEEISRGVKVLAKQLDIPILLLSQLNREVEKRTPPRPVASDLKESGAIEEDADAILLMWTNEKKEEFSVVGIDVAKNRGGAKGVFGLRFEPKFQQWHDSHEPLGEYKGGPEKEAKPTKYGSV